MKNLIKILLFIAFSYAANDIVIISSKVGSEIDIHENRFYEVFPKVKNFLNAQIFQIDNKSYKINFNVNRKNKLYIYSKVINLRSFVELQNKINSKPVFSEKERTKMYNGMHFLKASKIIKEMEKPRYVKVLYGSNRRLAGTLVDFKLNNLFIQGPTKVEKIELKNIDLISYRLSGNEYLFLKPYIYAFSSIIGLLGAQIYNQQRSPKLDKVWYYRFFGIVSGLIFSSEFYDAIISSIAPKQEFILSQDLYEKRKKL